MKFSIIFVLEKERLNCYYNALRIRCTDFNKDIDKVSRFYKIITNK